MPNETCPYEAAVLAARRSGRWAADLSKHLQQCLVCTEISDVSERIENLGSQPNATALPDPDWLWMRAQISARQDAAARVLRMSMLRQTLLYGLFSAGAAWLFLDWMATEGSALDAWAQTIASMAADPVVNVAISALAAVGIAFLTGGLVLARPLVASRLRYFGLL